METVTKRYTINNANERNVVYRNFQNAIHFYPLLSEKEIAPKFVSFNFARVGEQYVGQLTSEKLISSDKPLYKELLDTYYELIVDIFDEKVEKLHSLDICHGDMVPGNILFKSQPHNFEKPVDVFLIDFDRSFYISKGRDDENVVEFWLDSFPNKTYEEYVALDFDHLFSTVE